jgi:hypothetical protein
MVMDSKTSKTLSILAACAIFIAFFLPYTKSLFGASVSLWGFLSYGINHIKDISDLIPFVLIAIPICSGIIIFNNAKTLNDETDKTKIYKIITIVVFLLLIITLIYAQTENIFSSFTNIFDILGIGFYLMLIGTGYYLVDILTVKTQSLSPNNTKAINELFEAIKNIRTTLYNVVMTILLVLFALCAIYAIYDNLIKIR